MSEVKEQSVGQDLGGIEEHIKKAKELLDSCDEFVLIVRNGGDGEAVVHAKNSTLIQASRMVEKIAYMPPNEDHSEGAEG